MAPTPARQRRADNGTDEDGVELAAKYFEVSQQVINTTLVNKRKVSRDRLPVA